MDKKATERLVFDRFRAACPLFAGGHIRIIPASQRASEGQDPVPDFLCRDTSRRRIGVELGEWLSPEQMATDIEQDRLEKSYSDAEAIHRIPRPPHIGIVRLFPRPRMKLTGEDALAFSVELEKYLWALEDGWDDHRERRSPQGFRCADFSGYPCLEKRLEELRIEAAQFYTPPEGTQWIWFPTRVSAFTPQTAVQALADLLNDKCAKYTTLKQDKVLAALYLVVYYAQAFQHNTPYVPLTLRQVAERARMAATACPGPFDAIYLFDLMRTPEEVVRVWPGSDEALSASV